MAQSEYLWDNVKSVIFVSKRIPMNYPSETPEISAFSLLLPAGTFDYFDLVSFESLSSCHILFLEEKNIIPLELSSFCLHSNGFFPEIEIQDFPIRGKAVYLRIKRRRWRDIESGKSYSRDWNLVATGTRITSEFGAFLKGLLR